MILQALTRYYERSEHLPREGWVRRGVDYVVVLNSRGECVNVESIGEIKKGKTVPSERLVMAIGKQAMKHTNSGKDANLLWDNANFVLGTGNKGALKLACFLDTLATWLGAVNDPGVEAVKLFCQDLQKNPTNADALIARFQLKDDFDKRDPVLIFRLADDLEGIHLRPSVRAAYNDAFAASQSSDGLRGNCLVSGQTDAVLAPNESVIKGVWGDQPAGRNIVSFNARAFESYGKRNRNGENAPISAYASFAYTTALNHLLSSTQRIQVANASTVFWAEEQHELENAIPDLFGEPRKDDPDKNVRAVETLYSAVQAGKFAAGEPTTRFHVLGLSPNAARISIRFWETSTALELSHCIKQHFDDIEVIHADYEPRYLSLLRLLAGVALLGRSKNIPPSLGGDVVRAVFTGLPYPATLLNQAVIRCRAEQKVTYARAAAIKASLNRRIRFRPSTEKEFLPMLDRENINPGYRLGRLFAALERIQEDAAGGSGKLNSTIRDRYYGAASSTPAAVFSTLLRLSKHHLGKLSKELAIIRERLIEEIMSGFDADSFPPRILPLADQARFALGYYHQRQAFFTKSESIKQEKSQ
ncbi:type I-C CRISPR-associated protein Cas8c/Csd1 [Bordetella petrii]|nr:type I-C CRISPR-associated protein Cas8c/Csd1 [Bordetella petrii]